MIQKILIPIDTANAGASEGAVGMAADLARKYGAVVSIATIAPWALSRSPTEMETAQSKFRQLAVGLSEKAGMPFEAIFRAGDSVSLTLREIVEEFDIDLVVMSSHDPAVSDYLFGSHAASVTLHAPCSVMVVR